MKKLILSCLCVFCIFNTFALDGILTEDEVSNYVNANLLSEFVSSVTANPAIYHDQWNNPIYTAASPIDPTLDFKSIDTSFTFLNKGLAQQIEESTVSIQSVIWTGTSKLSNTSTMMQTLQSQEFQFTKSDSVSTATTEGWKVGASVEPKFKFTFGVPVVPEVPPVPPVPVFAAAPASGAPASGAPAVAAPAYGAPASGAPASNKVQGLDEVTVKVSGEYNYSTTDSTSCTTARSYIAKSQNVQVAPGCTAIVDQTLLAVTSSGPYTFSSYIDPKSSTKISTSCCGSGGKKNVKTGTATIANIVKYGTVPQSAMSVDSAGNILLTGKGNYIATAGTQFEVRVHVQEGNDLYGNPCTAQLESQTLYMSNNSNDRIYNYQNLSDGFSYSYMANSANKNSGKLLGDSFVCE